MLLGITSVPEGVLLPQLGPHVRHVGPHELRVAAQQLGGRQRHPQPLQPSLDQRKRKKKCKE